MKQLFIVLFVLFVYSCKTQQNIVQNIKIGKYLELEAKKVYPAGEKINLNFKNISGEKLVIYRPMEKFIYRKSGDEWKRVNVLYCPCDASCPPPPDKQELLSNQTHIINWDQKEDSCSEKRVKGVRKTIEKQVEPGIYRVQIVYSTTSIPKEKYYYEFEIK